MRYEHQPVLVSEVLTGLALKPDGIYVDATFGRGGHSLEILKGLGPDGRLMAMDKDPEAIVVATAGPFLDRRFAIVHASFTHLGDEVKKRGWSGQVNGILLDLGVSSPQLDDPQRGFSFVKEGPLDMRMNPEQGMDASTWINRVREAELANVLWEYGEERFSRRIAGAIVGHRKKQPITTTLQLAEIIKHAVPRREPHKHPATRSFQAIRIFINRELDELKEVLSQAYDVLTEGGRLCVISFHSLEDRIAKQFIKDMSRGEVDARGREIPRPHRLKKIGTLIRPAFEEIKLNPRARSARLRIAEKQS